MEFKPTRGDLVLSSPPSTRPGRLPASVKTPSDYVRAVRRRIWLVLIIAIPIATTGTLIVLRMQAIYQVTARIEIKAPQVDPTIVADRQPGRGRPEGPRPTRNTSPTPSPCSTTRAWPRRSSATGLLGLPPSALEGDAAAELASQGQDPPDPPVAPLRRDPRRQGSRTGSPGPSTSSSGSSATRPTPRAATSTIRPSRKSSALETRPSDRGVPEDPGRS